MREVLLSTHPGLYRYNSGKSLEASFKKLQNQWKSPTSEKIALKQLAQFLEKIHCGHTCIKPYNLKDSLKNTMYPVDGFLPLYFRIVEGKIIVTENASGDQAIKKGQEIVEINGVNTTTILDSLITAVKSDGNKNIANKYKSLEISEQEQFSTFDMLYPTFFPATNKFSLGLKDFRGDKISFITVQGLSGKERYERISKINTNIPINNHNPWTLTPGKYNTCILKMANWFTYSFKTDWHEILDHYFDTIKSNHTKHLIIDLRGNIGGDGSVSSELLSYISNKELIPNPLYREIVRTAAIDKKFWSYFLPWGDTYKRVIPSDKLKKIDDNYFQVIGGKHDTIVPKKNHFKGKVYIIIDASNSSATFNFIDAVKQNKIGTIVGQRSGGNRQGINANNFVFLSLPNTKLRIDIPLVFNDPGYKRPDGGILPDYEVLTKQVDIVDGNDPQLTFIENLIAK